MRVRLTCLLLLLGFALAACAGGTPAPTPATSVAEVPAGQVTPPAESDYFNTGCTVESPQPTPGPTEVSIFPPVTGEDWILGPEEAPVTILAYSDFQCESCARLASMYPSLLEQFPEELRIIHRHLPLTGTPENPYHDKAALAAQAAEAAGEQGAFWAMHDLIFSRQGEWIEMEPGAFQDWLVENAGELSLDTDLFSEDLAAEENAARMQAAWEHAAANGMLAAPMLLINGQIWPPNIPLDQPTLESLIRLNLLEERQFTTCPPMEIDPGKEYTAVIETEKGEIRIALLPDKAPIAVNNFVFLARQGWYDGVTFHRVLPGFMAQAGDPTGTGLGGPGYAFVNEISDLKFDRAGVVGMANAGPDTNGSQFFITYAAAPHLDGGYTIFGEVLQGMEVLEAITPRNPEQAANLPPGDMILSVTIIEE